MGRTAPGTIRIWDGRRLIYTRTSGAAAGRRRREGEDQLEKVRVAANRRDEIAALVEFDAFEPLGALDM